MEVIKLTDSEVKTLDMQNTARRLAGLQQLTIVVRSCMSCKARFESFGNKTCRDCDSKRRATARALSSAIGME